MYLYSPGWGSSGPYASRQSFAPLLSIYCGIGFEVAGELNPPLWPVANEDSGNGLWGAIGILIGLHRRAQGFSGAQYIENPQLNAALQHISHQVWTEDGALANPQRLDPMQYGFSSLDRLYETADGWICLSACTPESFDALSSVVGELAIQSDFSTEEQRLARDYEISSILAERFATETTAIWVRKLSDVGVPVAEPVGNGANQRFMRDPANRASRRVAVHEHPDLGAVYSFDLLLRMTGALPEHRPSPELGENTQEILRELGYNDNDIATLYAQCVVR